MKFTRAPRPSDAELHKSEYYDLVTELIALGDSPDESITAQYEDGKYPSHSSIQSNLRARTKNSPLGPRILKMRNVGNRLYHFWTLPEKASSPEGDQV